MHTVDLNKNDLELFKQAVEEAFSNKIDSIAKSYTGEIEHSEKHELAMRTIVYGKIENHADKRRIRLKSKYIVAIIVAAALLLTSCGIIFRHKIREIFRGEYVRLDYGEDGIYGEPIKDIYTLTYIPEGYSLKMERINKASVRYKYINENNEFIEFMQAPIHGSSLNIDNDTEYSEMIQVQQYDIYHRLSNGFHFYVYTEEKHVIKLKSSVQLSNEELGKIIEGITIK